MVTLGKWFSTSHITTQNNGQGEAFFIRSFEKSRGYGPLVDASLNPGPLFGETGQVAGQRDGSDGPFVQDQVKVLGLQPSFCMGAYFFFLAGLLMYIINLEGHKKFIQSEHFQGNSLNNAMVMGEVCEVSN